MIWPILLVLFTQVSVSSTGISVTDLDVNKVLTPITSRAGSFFDVIIAFATVIVVVWFVKVILGFVKGGK